MLVKKITKKVITMGVLSAFLFSAIFLYGCSNEKELSMKDLKNKTGKECITILKEYGLDLPEVYEEDSELAEEAVKDIVDNIDSLIDDGIAYSYTELVNLAEQIVDIAKTYDSEYAQR